MPKPNSPDQKPELTEQQTAERNLDVDRRRFVKSFLTSVSAAGMACVIPAQAMAKGAKPAQYVCIIEFLGQVGEVYFYRARNCTTNATYTFAGGPGYQLGNCGDPVGTNCVERNTWDAYTVTDDDLKIVLSPALDESQLIEVDKIRSLLLKSR